MNAELRDYLRRYQVRHKEKLMGAGDQCCLDPHAVAKLRALIEKEFELLKRLDEEKKKNP
ncbi:MAG: hypothetical protein IKP04_05085 [Candidatus Methanomethylophilaceae archaeon]|nr:hypothetical protein [Candidatus Methanomethylophilaceae archaeon]